MLPKTLSSILTVWQPHAPASWLLTAAPSPLNLAHSGFFFTLHSHRILPAVALFAVLAPGFRARKVAAAPLEAVRPADARILLRLRRDPTAQFSSTTAGESALALEQGAEHHLLVHYTGPQGTLTIAGGWLGSGRRRYIWLPLRPTLSWNTPDGPRLTPADIATLAADLHSGLDQMNMRHVLEAFDEPIPIPQPEKREVLKNYSTFMLAHGWDVSYDEALSRRSLKRTVAGENPERWSSADREVLTRMEALVSEMLKGVRSSSRMLYQTR